HQVDHARDHFGAVLDGLAAAQLAAIGGQVHHRAAHLVHAGLEAHARARGGLFEDHRQRAVGQRLVLLVVLEARLDDGGALEEVFVLLRAQIFELQVMFDQAHTGLHGWSTHAVLVSERKALIRGTRMATISSASSGWRIRAGSRRMTLSAVTLSSRPASMARDSSTPQGRSSSMPIIRPWPRISTTPATLASSRAKASLRCLPMREALASSCSSSMILMVSTPARMANGLPPKVVPWLPGWNTLAALGPHTTAPMGTPEPRPLASGITSGWMPARWWANHLPVRPMPHCTSSSISSQPFSSQSLRTACRYSERVGLMPPSPWITSRKTAVTFGRVRATSCSASMSLRGTRTKPSTSGSKPAWILG